jgi:hypothetical protein
LSCNAPATISLADAEFSFIKTNTLPFSKSPLSVAKLFSMFPRLFLVNKISLLSSKNSSTICSAIPKKPPGLSLKSKAISVAPAFNNLSKPFLNSLYVDSAKRLTLYNQAYLLTYKQHQHF